MRLDYKKMSKQRAESYLGKKLLTISQFCLIMIINEIHCICLILIVIDYIDKIDEVDLSR